MGEHVKTKKKGYESPQEKKRRQTPDTAQIHMDYGTPEVGCDRR